jgi:hypothetical protein
MLEGSDDESDFVTAQPKRRVLTKIARLRGINFILVPSGVRW